MAEEPQTICDWLGIELDKLSADDKMKLIEEIYEELIAHQLRQVHDLVDQNRLEKLDKVKTQIIKKIRGKFVQLGLDFDETMGFNRSQRGGKLPPKYISPNGETWSGRGYPPQWIRDLEEEGHNREDYRLQEEDAGNR